jgi:hypothetical protein
MADPNDCRANAARCIEMANEASNTQMQSIMFEMARIWLQVAGESEQSYVPGTQLRDAGVTIESKI